ncbi:MAG TPA: DUF4105 domain-containing protein [Bacteroidales bacterium]|nr:DUF4105 domain-containing protein [Bacteroidales bacterium]
MKTATILKSLVFIVFMSVSQLISAQKSDTTLYLITCGPGTEIYSIYGHSALLVRIDERDTVYNWGVFDFDAPHFGWRFAQGNLDYMLIQERLRYFLGEYFYYKRYVLSQEINLEPDEKRIILDLITENLKPENVKYRYDFFYDDCSTRIRDLLEKAIGSKLIYPSDYKAGTTFRDLIGEYQQFYPWLQFGIDLLVGSNAEKTAGIRDKMFLPDYLMSVLSATSVKRDTLNKPLLNRADVLLDFAPPALKKSFFTAPLFVFSLLLVILIILSYRLRSRVQNNIMDFSIFFVFAILSLLMIFFNFFTGHEQLRANYNILWLNPFVIVLFIAILIGKNERLWARIVFYLTVAFLVIHLFIPQAFNVADYPVILIIILRTIVRGEFKWSPVKLS